MTTILITGADGQVGRELQALAPRFASFKFLFTDRRSLDITRADQIAALFQRSRPDFCINCAAYTAVDQAESEPELARQVNALGPAFLAEACRAHGATLLHLSTDYVYHTGQNRPFCETDPTAPQSVYARTKLAGEAAVLEGAPGAIVLRTSWVYSPFGANFVKTMLRLAEDRDELRVVCDQIGTPTYAADLAETLLAVVQYCQNTPATPPSGIFNYSNEGVASWYDFAVAIMEISGKPCRVTPIPSSAYPTSAQRPPFSVLNKEKIKSTFHLELPHWRSSLQKCLSRL